LDGLVLEIIFFERFDEQLNYVQYIVKMFFSLLNWDCATEHLLLLCTFFHTITSECELDEEIDPVF